MWGKNLWLRKVRTTGWYDSTIGKGLLRGLFLIGGHRIVMDAMAAVLIPDLADAAAETRERTGGARLRDSHGRAITDLRLSVTDRCNYRCVYCRSAVKRVWHLRSCRLRSICAWCGCLCRSGMEKVRLTGGEPLLRAGLVEMVRGAVGDADGVWRRTDDRSSRGTGEPLDLALTTNGHLLESDGRGSEGCGAGAGDGEHGCGGGGDCLRGSRGCREALSGCLPGCGRRRLQGWVR